MYTSKLVSFRFALLSSMGLIHACSGRSSGPADNDSGASSNVDASLNPSATAPDDASVGPVDAATSTELSDASNDASLTVVDARAGEESLDAGADARVPQEVVDAEAGPGAATEAGAVPPAVVDAGDASVLDAGDASVLDADASFSVCPKPRELLDDGLERCANAVVHRVAQPQCGVQLPRSVDYRSRIEDEINALGGIPDGGVELTVPFSLKAGGDGGMYAFSYQFECFTDLDCTSSEYGFCEYYEADGGIPRLRLGQCRTGCAEDSDCSDEQHACECGESFGTCVVATCRTDDECEPGSVCAQYTPNAGCTTSSGASFEYACITAADECLSDMDCPDDDVCTVGEQGFRVCEERTECVFGRPLLIDGSARVAGLRSSTDWLLMPGDEVASALPQTLRGLAADGWRAIGLMEHASVAAFARFALQLVAVGAPPEMIAAAQAALADEVHHAQLAFGLACALDGRQLGPTALDTSGAAPLTTLAQIVLNTVLEGCIGETVAALQATLALDHATDPAVRCILERIELDETRHAELAWTFVRWALTHRPTLAHDVARLVERELSQANTRNSINDKPPAEVSLLAVGLVGPRHTADLHRRVLETIVSPCMNALCAEIGRVAA